MSFATRFISVIVIGITALSAFDVSALALTGVTSRKVHGSAGTFDLAIDTAQAFAASVTVEPRTIGAGHVIVFQFDGTVTATGTVNAFDAFGPVGSVLAAITGASNTPANNEVSVTLAGVPDNKRVSITLSQVNGLLDVPAVSMGFLVGDVNSTRSANSSDISSVKARSGQTTLAASYLFDLNASGAINSSDISAVKARSGLTLPAATEVSLQVSKLGTGSGNVSSVPGGINCGSTCSANFTQNTSITLSATPDPGSTFSGWAGICAGVGATSTFNMVASSTCSATFPINTYTVTPSAGLNGTIGPSTPQTVNWGMTATFTVTPTPGFNTSVVGTCGGVLVGTTYTTYTITGPCTVEATFLPWPVWSSAIPAVPPSTTGRTLYVDGTNGINTNTGLTSTTAFKTIAKAITLIVAGDTVLIRKGLYREGIVVVSAPSGTALKPITFGSYGDGEVILDGSTKVTGWTNVSGTVWKAPLTFMPSGIVVNEIPLKQVTQGQGGSGAPQVGLAGVTSGSGKWHNGGLGGFITADMGSAGDPNLADIVVPNDIGDQAHVYFYQKKYLNFKGLTVRGSGSNGIWGYGSNITIESCNVKFNAKSAISFQPLTVAGETNSDNAVLTTHAYHNMLLNWPRGNNGYIEAGGGWGGGIGWSGNLRPLARGNIVHMNGGEGIITYGTNAGFPSGSALFEQNVSHDNWSVNMYFDNQPNDVARNNLIFNHPPDNNNYLYIGAFPYDQYKKFTVCLMLADEQGSSDATNNFANLANSEVYNNILAGCRIGIRDYSESPIAQANHGLKNTRIVNNTIIMPFVSYAPYEALGIYLLDNTSPSGTNRNINTVIQNNVIYGFNSDSVIASEIAGPLVGINLNYNTYFSTAANPFRRGFNTVVYSNLAGWKTAITGSDINSQFLDPQLVDVTQFRVTGVGTYDPYNANLRVGSPAIGSGTPQTFTPALNYSLTTRLGWNTGAF